MEKTITVIVVRRKLTQNKSKTIKVTEAWTIVKRNKVKTINDSDSSLEEEPDDERPSLSTDVGLCMCCSTLPSKFQGG